MYVAEEVSEDYKQPPPDGVASDAGPKLGTKPEPIDAQKGSMMDVFARCLKKKIA